MDKQKKIDTVKTVLSVAAIAGGFITINDVIDRNVRDGNIVTKACVLVAKIAAGCFIGNKFASSIDQSVNNVVQIYDEIEANSKVE